MCAGFALLSTLRTVEDWRPGLGESSPAGSVRALTLCDEE